MLAFPVDSRPKHQLQLPLSMVTLHVIPDNK